MKIFIFFSGKCIILLNNLKRANIDQTQMQNTLYYFVFSNLRIKPVATNIQLQRISKRQNNLNSQLS